MLATKADSKGRRLQAVDPPAIETLPSEVVALATLKPHPQNYRAHPPTQLAHLEASLREHGLYRNIVVARDYTVLAGHGVYLTAQQAGMTEIEVKRADVDPFSPSAIRLLTGDNEIARLVEVDERALAELIGNTDPADLLGTGFDEEQLAELLAVTGIAGEREARFLDDLANPGANPTHASEGGRLQRAEPTPRQLVVTATEEERAEIISLLNQLRDQQQLPTLTDVLLWALRQCLAPAD